MEELNEHVRSEIQGYLDYAVENALAGVRYERVQGDGPRIRDNDNCHPLFSRYFTPDLKLLTFDEYEKNIYTAEGKAFMAHNGWVMSADPLVDFALPQPGRGNVYLKRELIAWGDSVKLRYGERPDDSPYLWSHMRKYVENTARIFDGVRLDNCHSTPLHVAEYLLDCARKVNPDLYVVAELFTNSDNTDNIFVNRLGITSLIRGKILWNQSRSTGLSDIDVFFFEQKHNRHGIHTKKAVWFIDMVEPRLVRSTVHWVDR